MLSLGIGLQQLATRRLVKSGLFDTVVVTSRRDLRNFNRGDDQGDGGPDPAQSPALDEPSREKIAALPNVVEANPDLRFITSFTYDDKPHLTMAAGIPGSYRTNDAFDGMQGAFFSSDTAPEVILQKSFAAELLEKTPKPGSEEAPVAALAKPLLGKEMTMRYAEQVAGNAGGDHASSQGKLQADSNADSDASATSYSIVSHELKLKIVGVTDLDPDSMRGPVRARVLLPLKLLQSLHVVQPTALRDTTQATSKIPTYGTVSVRVKDPAKIQAVEDSIKKMGFNTFSMLDATRSLRRFFTILDLFLGIFGSLALAVASIGIVNTLVMAILERRREIGIMKAIGGSDEDVRKLFFVEAGVMGLFGGAVGVALGWTIGRIINAGTNIYLRRQDLSPEQIWFVPWWLVIGAIVFAIVVSLISGVYPATRASRLDPVQALRYE